MKRNGVVVPLAALLLAACGGGSDEGSKTDVQASPDTAGAVGTTTGTSTGLSTGQQADTAGMPGAADTTQGTATAP
jgi:hypothetical protein